VTGVKYRCEYHGHLTFYPVNLGVREAARSQEGNKKYLLNFGENDFLFIYQWTMREIIRLLNAMDVQCHVAIQVFIDFNQLLV